MDKLQTAGSVSRIPVIIQLSNKGMAPSEMGRRDRGRQPARRHPALRVQRPVLRGRRPPARRQRPRREDAPGAQGHLRVGA